MAFAQAGAITGKVIDATTQTPIEDVTISINGSTLSAKSRVNGVFTILGVPPGTYTVTAKRVGYGGRAFTRVEVQIERPRSLTFYLRPATSDTVEATEVDPLFLDPALGTARLFLNRDQILHLPSLSLAGGLGLNGGYLRVPLSSSTFARADFRRGVTSTPSVRGARSEETLYLLEGFDVSNPVYGTLPLLVEPLAAASLSFSPAYVDAEHGGALSGLVNQAIRQGGNEFSGAFEYQTTSLAALAGAKGNDATRARAARGTLSGPIPFTANRGHFAISGHLLGDRLDVIKPTGRDWIGTGDFSYDQLVTKLNYALRPSLLFSLAGVGQSHVITDIEPIRGDSVASATTRNDAAFVVGRIEKRFTNANVSLAVASNRGSRETCSIWQGVCIEDRLQRRPQGAEVPAFGIPPLPTPYTASGQYYGGETFRTDAIRADATIQASDHNRVQAGIYGARHTLSYQDVMGFAWVQGVVQTVRDVYRVQPVEFSSYVQDVISHDLITLHIGVRFDHGNAGGFAFANPRNPTNGTTAREVCNGAAPGINESAFTYNDERGILACLNSPDMGSGRPFLLDSATRMAQADDFIPVTPRAAFSPRIGLSLPITETSSMFVNFGRYNRNPLYHDAFRNTGTGSRAGVGAGADGMCETSRRPSGSECAPNFLVDPSLPEFVGNPSLSFETANNWEAGFTLMADSLHSVEGSVFSVAASHLPTLVTAQHAVDFGQTYGPIGDRIIRTVVGSGAQYSLGFSLTVRRRLRNHYSYSINYSYLRSDEFGRRPDIAAQALAFNASVNVNTVSEQSGVRSRPHILNAQFVAEWRDVAPVKGRVGALLLKDSRTVVTLTMAASGKLSRDGFQNGSERGTGKLVDLLYSRNIASAGPQWSFVLRVRNLLNANDGVLNIAPAASGDYDVMRRRILTGIALAF